MKQFLSAQPSSLRLIFGIILAILIAGFIFVSGLVGGAAFFQMGVSEFVNNASITIGGNPNILRYFMVLQGLSLFIAPSACIALLVRREGNPFFHTVTVKPIYIYGVASAAILFALPFVNFLAEFNRLLVDVIFGADTWMADSEAKAKALTESILNTIHVKYLFLNIFILAVIPAIGEELFFRGTIQELLFRKTKNVHVAVILTGIMFSALHMQFYGFIPRVVMGVFLGYLYVWFKNIWVPIAVHFANNAMAVVMYYYIFNDQLPASFETVGSDTDTLGLTIASCAAVLMLVWLLAKKAGIALFPSLRDLTSDQ